MGPEEEFKLHNEQNSWPILFEVSQKFRQQSITVSLTDDRTADTQRGRSRREALSLGNGKKLREQSFPQNTCS